MEAERFDPLLHSLFGTTSRRDALRILAGAGFGGFVTIDTVSTEARKGRKRKGKGKGKDKQKVRICHNGQTITVSKTALKAHLKHGDTTGACPTQDSLPPSPSVADATCSGPGNSNVTGSRRFAQTFVALRSGQLTSATIELEQNQDSADFVVEIRTVDGSGVPTNTVLATTTVDNVPSTAFGGPPRTITADFSAPAAVVAGQTYALSLTVGVTQTFTLDVHNNNPCGDGPLYGDAFADGTFNPVGSADMIYATFVRV
jgi:hypothetical protein